MPTTTVDGRSIAYDYYPGANQPLVFVHGWCCGRWAFAPQVGHFLAQGHEIVTLDLPGHGASGALTGTTSMRTLTEAVRGTMAAVGMERAVIVGHSMGGMAALLLAKEHPELVEAVVAVDPAPMVARFPDLGPIAQANAAFHADDATRTAVQQAFIESFFQPGAVETVRRLALTEMTSAPLDTMLGCWDALYEADGPSILAGVQRPVLHIAATPPLNPVDTFAAMVGDCTTGWTVGAGHFNQLEVPDQVNSMIERYLRALTLR